MLNEQTKAKLRAMKLSAVIDAADAMGAVPGSEKMSHEEWLGVVTDHLYEVKMATKLENLIKNANLGEPTACLEDLCTDADREIDAGLISELATGSYIAKGHNVICLSAAGGGKTWLISALGVAACRQYVRTAYVNYRDMLDELAIARKDAAKHEALVKRLSNVPLLIVDDYLLKDADEGDMDELFAVVDRRAVARKSTILASQYLVGGWAERMGGYPAAESVVDRVKNRAYTIELKGDVSMRERFMDPEIRAYVDKREGGSR